MKRILVVEDDPSISLGLRMNLEAEGFAVTVAEDGASGLEKSREAWDLLILDVMLPHVNGFEIVRALRAAGTRTPVLMLSAKNGEMDKVLGLELGADDYVTKPFSLAELLARVRVALRRGEALPPPKAPPDEHKFGDVVVSLATHGITKAGKPIDVTPRMFDVLVTLIEARGRVLSRQQIFDAVWGPNHHGTLRTIDNFVGQLRTKLEDHAAEPKHLLTVRGVGYRFAT